MLLILESMYILLIVVLHDILDLLCLGMAEWLR